MWLCAVLERYPKRTCSERITFTGRISFSLTSIVLQDVNLNRIQAIELVQEDRYFQKQEKNQHECDRIADFEFS